MLSLLDDSSRAVAISATRPLLFGTKRKRKKTRTSSKTRHRPEIAEECPYRRHFFLPSCSTQQQKGEGEPRREGRALLKVDRLARSERQEGGEEEVVEEEAAERREKKRKERDKEEEEEDEKEDLSGSRTIARRDDRDKEANVNEADRPRIARGSRQDSLIPISSGPTTSLAEFVIAN